MPLVYAMLFVGIWMLVPSRDAYYVRQSEEATGLVLVALSAGILLARFLG